MEEKALFFRFGVALFIGILVGLQREYASDKPGRELAAGVRTFALMGLIGCAAALASDQLNSPWPFVATVVVLGAFFAVNYFVESWRGEAGLTTEVAVILTVLSGALAYWHQITLAVALGVAMTVLLSIKMEMSWLVQHITREDMFATLKFAVISAIILPVLPNRSFGPPPFDVLNPHKIWLLVVFISGISLVGYILIKLVGHRRGIGLTGLIGGLASSTAVTLSFTQKSRSNRSMGQALALAIILSWTVMFARVLVEVAVVNASLLSRLWAPVVSAIAAGILYSLYLFKVRPTHGEEEVAFSNPFELGPAIQFGLIFTGILLVSRAAQNYLGDTGLYLSSVVSGLADVDAITLSVADLSRRPDAMAPQSAVQAIVFAAVSNTFAKGAIVLIGGAPTLRRGILPGALLMMAVALAVVLFGG